MFASIKNGQISKKSYVIHPYKKSCEGFLNVLWDEGFILGYKILDSDKNFSKLKIFLKYQNNSPVINSIAALSKPSLKIYYSVKQLWKIDSSKSTIILSTSKGFKSLNECKKLNIGGEPVAVIK